MNVCNSFLYDSKKLNTTQTSFNSKRINRLWYILAVEHNSAVKQNELLMHTKSWMNLKETTLREISLRSMHTV